MTPITSQEETKVPAKNARPLLSAYLIHGDDELKAARALERLYTRLEQEGVQSLDFNRMEFDAGKGVTDTELLEALNTPPLGAPYRLVVLKQSDKAVKTVVDALVDYLKRPADTSILVLLATKLASNSRLLKAVSAVGTQAVINVISKKKAELPDHMRELAQSTYQISLSYDAAKALVNLQGDSMVALNTELAKLAAYLQAQGKSAASVADVMQVVPRVSLPTVWDFVDAFANRDLTACLAVVRLTPNADAPVLLMSWVRRLRELMLYQSLAARRQGSLAQLLGKPDWQIRKLEAWARRWRPSELSSLLARCAQANARMFGGEDAGLVLQELLLAYCT